MLSMPPATTRLASPSWMASAAIITAFSPEPQTLLMVTAPTDGVDRPIDAWRAGFCPCPAPKTLPMITSSTRPVSSLARVSSAWMQVAPAARRGPPPACRSWRRSESGALDYPCFVAHHWCSFTPEEGRGTDISFDTRPKSRPRPLERGRVVDGRTSPAVRHAPGMRPATVLPPGDLHGGLDLCLGHQLAPLLGRGLEVANLGLGGALEVLKPFRQSSSVMRR